MADKSNIEWTDATWPIVQGCDPVSQGCVHCYAVQLLWRMAHHPDPHISEPVKGLVERYTPADGEPILRFTGKLALREDRLTWPLQWKKPRMIFVPSHGDLFHKDVPDDFIDKVFAIMALCPQHTFQVLTKRAERMREYFEKLAADDRACDGIGRWHAEAAPVLGEAVSDEQWEAALSLDMPLDNVWLGVSCEDQKNADERIPQLLQTPAAIRFVSAEPLLGPIDFTKVRHQLAGDSFMVSSALHGDDGFGLNARRERLDWIIVGGESGKGARPMDPRWVRSIKQQCEAAGVQFFFKQWGRWLPMDQRPPDDPLHEQRDSFAVFGDGSGSYRDRAYDLGKREAGRTLDGVEHNAFPKVAA